MSDIFKGSKKDDSDLVKQLHSKWTKEQENLLAEWAEKASCYRWLHGRAEKKNRRSNYSFTIPVIIMSTLTGTANFAMDSFVPEEHKKTAMAAIGGVNILAGIISTLQNFLRYAELMESHRSSGIAWSKLCRDISIELALDPPRRKPARDFLNICRAEYDRLIEQSPMIDDVILKQFHAKFHNTDINKPEMCNGLDKCEIYQPSKEERNAEMLANVATKLSNKKKRMFTMDKHNSHHPPNTHHQHLSHNTPQVKNDPSNNNMTELSGLASLGKVSSLKNLKLEHNPTNSENIKENFRNQLKSVFEKNDVEVQEEVINGVENLIPKTPKLVKTVSIKDNLNEIIDDTIHENAVSNLDEENIKVDENNNENENNNNVNENNENENNKDDIIEEKVEDTVEENVEDTVEDNSNNKEIQTDIEMGDINYESSDTSTDKNNKQDFLDGIE